MTTTHLNNLANQLFSNWMKKFPECGKGEYLSEETNFVLAFDEFMSTSPFPLIKEILPTIKDSEFMPLKQYISDGIETYLLENAKILALK